MSAFAVCVSGLTVFLVFAQVLFAGMIDNAFNRLMFIIIIIIIIICYLFLFLSVSGSLYWWVFGID